MRNHTENTDVAYTLGKLTLKIKLAYLNPNISANDNIACMSTIGKTTTPRYVNLSSKN